VGLWEYFDENGQLMSRTNWKDGEEDGPYETFHENSQLKYRGNHIDGRSDGLFEYFDEDGNLTGAEMWRNGELVETKVRPF